MRPTIPNFVIGPFRRILGSNSDVLASSEEQVSAVRWTLDESDSDSDNEQECMSNDGHQFLSNPDCQDVCEHGE
jgi:hypothetical protein